MKTSQLENYLVILIYLYCIFGCFPYKIGKLTCSSKFLKVSKCWKHWNFFVTSFFLVIATIFEIEKCFHFWNSNANFGLLSVLQFLHDILFVAICQFVAFKSFRDAEFFRKLLLRVLSKVYFCKSRINIEPITFYSYPLIAGLATFLSVSTTGDSMMDDASIPETFTMFLISCILWIKILIFYILMHLDLAVFKTHCCDIMKLIQYTNVTTKFLKWKSSKSKLEELKRKQFYNLKKNFKSVQKLHEAIHSYHRLESSLYLMMNVLLLCSMLGTAFQNQQTFSMKPASAFASVILLICGILISADQLEPEVQFLDQSIAFDVLIYLKTSYTKLLIQTIGKHRSKGHLTPTVKGRAWSSGRVLDCRRDGRGFEPHQRHLPCSRPSCCLVMGTWDKTWGWWRWLMWFVTTSLVFALQHQSR